MQTLDDRELLREYVARDSDEAFATLVARHVNLVYSVALRHTGNPHQAEEITQAVFVVLARKARALRPGTVVSGWLFHAARLTASNFLRNEIRRIRREQEAYMQSTLQETGTDGDWKQIAPLLDSAIASLGETDRNAIVLRYVEGMDLKQVGAALGTGEEAAKKRVRRAVDKLRGFFVKRGVLLPVAGLTAAIAANSAQAAPAGLAASAAALAAAKGTTAGASTLALIKGTIKLMAWTKARIAIGVGVTVLLATGGGLAVSELKGGSGPQTAAEIARLARDKYNSLTSYRDTGTLLSKSGKLADEKTDSKSSFETVLDRAGHYRVSEMKQFTTNNGTNWADPMEQASWFAGEGHFSFYKDKSWENPGNIPADSMAFIGGLPVGVPLSFFKPDGYLLRVLAPPNNVTREKDEKIGDVDCYVLAGDETDQGKFTLCIGKPDFLIHQLRQTYTGRMLEMPDGGKAKSRDSVTIETHEHISVNGPVTLADFTFVPAETGLTAAEIAKKVHAKYESLSSYRDTGTSVDSGYDTPFLGTTKWTINTRLARTNYYLIEAKTTNLTMTAWSEGRDNFAMSQRSDAGKETCTYWKSDNRNAALNRLMAGKELPGLFFRVVGSDEDTRIARGVDEKIRGIDCYVLTNTAQELEGRPVQFIIWIGKQDWLIRQTRYVTPAPEGTEEYTTTHENISVNEPVKPEDFAIELPANAVLSGPDREVTPQVVR